jgi:hypothetical protein
MTTTREDFTAEMAGMVSNLAFQLCLVPEDETLKAIKELHAGFVERYQELFLAVPKRATNSRSMCSTSLSGSGMSMSDTAA